MEAEPAVGAMQQVELPQEGAMRWVREAAVSTDGAVVVARARLEAGHPCVREGVGGMGGVLLPAALIELMAQGAAAGVALAGGKTARRVKQGVLAAIKEFEVLGLVRVEDGGEIVLEIRAGRERAFGALSEVRFEVSASGMPVARARMTFHLQFE